LRYNGRKMKTASNGSPELTILGIETRVLKEFLDIIMLCELKARGELTGYDLAMLEREKFGISLSPGTVYMTIYAMERRGLIAGKPNGKKTTYSLTVKGERALEELKASGAVLVDFMKCVFPF
jgi:DNA-binding PadR family transcriptional regulator